MFYVFLEVLHIFLCVMYRQWGWEGCAEHVRSPHVNKIHSPNALICRHCSCDMFKGSSLFTLLMLFKTVVKVIYCAFLGKRASTHADQPTHHHRAEGRVPKHLQPDASSSSTLNLPLQKVQRDPLPQTHMKLLVSISNGLWGQKATICPVTGLQSKD